MEKPKWIPNELSGRKYRVSMVTVQPRITLLTDDGKDDGEFPSTVVAWYESQWGKALPEFLSDLGLEVKP